MDIPWIVSTVNILNIVSDVRKFKQWLLEFHKIDVENNIERGSEIILGYKFFFDTAFRELLEDLARVEEFGETDIVLQRATFKGISIENLPNSCEKTLLLKNLWYKYFEKVLNAQSWRDLEKRLDALRARVLSKFLRLFQCWIVPEKNHSLEELYKIWSINGALIWFTDTGKGGPKPYYYGLLPIRKEYYGNNNYFMDMVFRGYAYTLQFLWYSLLGEDAFKKVPHLDKMHIAEEIFYDECRKLLVLWNLSGSSEGESRTYLKWKCLDRFFGILHEHVVEKIEKQYGVSFGISDYKLFQLNPNCSQKEFLAGLYSEKVLEPSYIKVRSSPEEWQKWLDLKFLWYPIEVLDTFGIRVFNGAIAFVYILTGMVEHRQSQGIFDPVRVLRIKHPEDEGNVISYAVLVEASSSIADYSGWIVFYQVGTDFSGMGGFLHNLAESVIEKYRDFLIVEEITVDGEIFEQYLARNHPHRFSEDLQFHFEKLNLDIIKYQESITSLERLLSTHKGVFSELLTYYLLSSKRLHGSWEKVDWNVPVGGEQIDVFAINAEGHPWIFECKFDVHREDFRKILDQISRKRKAVLEKYKKEPTVIVVYLRNRHKYQINTLEEHGIRVLVLEPLLKKLLDGKDLDKLKEILKE